MLEGPEPSTIFCFELYAIHELRNLRALEGKRRRVSIC